MVLLCLQKDIDSKESSKKHMHEGSVIFQVWVLLAAPLQSRPQPMKFGHRQPKTVTACRISRMDLQVHTQRIR